MIEPTSYMTTKTLYDRIGSGYSRRRNPDTRIAQLIGQALSDNTLIANVGAGTGSYEPSNKVVIAIEPSAEMIAQRTSAGGRILRGTAENIPLRDIPPVTNTIPGAMAIQRLWDRIEWRGQMADATVMAPKLRRRPPSGVTARPIVIWVGRGDQTAMLAESSSIVKEGELEDRTVLYRHDLFFAANPTSIKTSHTVYRFQGPSAPTNSISVAIVASS